MCLANMASCEHYLWGFKEPVLCHGQVDDMGSGLQRPHCQACMVDTSESQTGDADNAQVYLMQQDQRLSSLRVVEEPAQHARGNAVMQAIERRTSFFSRLLGSGVVFKGVLACPRC